MVGMRLEMLPSSESMNVSPKAAVAFTGGVAPSTALSASPEQPAAANARRATAATGLRGMRQRTSGTSGYLDAGGVVGAGADGDPGAGGVAGTDTGGASRTTDEDRSPPRIASENEVRVKMIAITPVILPSTVGVPIEPNTAWLPAPPKAEPISAPLPACSSTMAMMAKHISTWMIVSAMTIYSPLVAAPRAAFFTIETNPCAFRLAPPTRAPSISLSARRASALSALTLPP